MKRFLVPVGLTSAVAALSLVLMGGTPITSAPRDPASASQGAVPWTAVRTLSKIALRAQ